MTSTRKRRKPRIDGAFVLVNMAMLWLTVLIGSVALWPIYESQSLIMLVAVSTAAGSAIVVMGALYRWSFLTVTLVTIATFFVVGVPLAVPTKTQFLVAPTLDGLRDLTSGIALGWKQLLTISLPVGNYEALLVPALVLVLGTVVVGGTVAIRSRHGELATIPPIVLLITAIAFGPQYPEQALLAPIAMLAATLGWLVWFRWSRRRAAIRLLARGAASRISDDAQPEISSAGVRTFVSAGVILAIASATGIAAAVAAPPTTDRSVLRTSIEQPFDPRAYVSPLAGFRRYWQPGTLDDVLFEVSGLPQGGLLRLATLDSYDGVVYSIGSRPDQGDSGSFVRVPSEFDQSRVSGDRVTIDVRAVGYSGVWVPTVGKFESVVFTGGESQKLRDGFYYNDTSGTAAIVGGLGAGQAYSITAIVPKQPAQNLLSTLRSGSAAVPRLVEAPDALTARLEQYTGQVDGQGARLVAMLDGLARDGYISHGTDEFGPPSRSGHSSDRIGALFSDPRMIGDAEQYAVAASLMARELGFASRIVVGFVPEAREVRGRDVHAWIEIDTAQYGWVAIDPTPSAREIPEELPQDSAQVARPPTIVPPPAVTEDPIDQQPAPAIDQEIPADPDPLIEILVIAFGVLSWVVLAVAIASAPFLLVIGAKLRRRRLRRSASSAIDRISGGWKEFEDSVLDHGLSPAAAATRSEVAAITGGVQSQVLAAVADRANFSPEEPSPADADSVWRAVDELQDALGAGLTKWQRLRAQVSLRSLGLYSVPKLFVR